VNVFAALAVHDLALGMHFARATSAMCVEVEFAFGSGVGTTWAAQVSVDAIRSGRDGTVRKTQITSHVKELIEPLQAELNQCALMIARQTENDAPRIGKRQKALEHVSTRGEITGHWNERSGHRKCEQRQLGALNYSYLKKRVKWLILLVICHVDQTYTSIVRLIT